MDPWLMVLLINRFKAFGCVIKRQSLLSSPSPTLPPWWRAMEWLRKSCKNHLSRQEGDFIKRKRNFYSFSGRCHCSLLLGGLNKLLVCTPLTCLPSKTKLWKECGSQFFKNIFHIWGLNKWEWLTMITGLKSTQAASISNSTITWQLDQQNASQKDHSRPTKASVVARPLSAS